jgi:hypothetical protein
MSYAKPTTEEIHKALKTLGTYRVIACQVSASEGPPDGIGGHHLLVTGLRETWLDNINGDKRVVQGKVEFRAKGCFQINEDYHSDFLREQVGCREGTWQAVAGHTATEEGFCPRFTPAMVYALDILKFNKLYSERRKIPERGQVSLRVAFNGYNRGIDGAIDQYFDAIATEGNIDAGTTGSDYGIWCIKNSQLIKKWLEAHDNWRPQ